MNPWEYQIEYKMRDLKSQREVSQTYLDLLERFSLIRFGENGVERSDGTQEKKRDVSLSIQNHIQNGYDEKIEANKL